MTDTVVNKQKMANVTDDGSRTTLQDFFCMPGFDGIHEEALIITAAFNIPLCITAFLGNVLIIVALQKVSSLHPPSKLLLGCLASTDLCVGLITQPLFVTFLLSSKHSKACYYLSRWSRWSILWSFFLNTNCN